MKRFLIVHVSVVLALICAHADVHYVSSAGDDQYPYTSWEHAAHVLQDAVVAASDGDTVVVASGTYSTGGHTVYGSMKNRVAIRGSIRVESLSGPASTSIIGEGPNGASAVRSAYVGEGATLSGFTLTDGHTLTEGSLYREQSGGGAWCEAGAIISNCVVTACGANEKGGGVFAYYGGIIRDCEIHHCNATGGGGGVYAYQGGVLRDSVVRDNESDWPGAGVCVRDSGAVSNCTISGNSGGSGVYCNGGGTIAFCAISGNSVSSALGGAGGVQCFGGGVIEHCIVASNTTTTGGGGIELSGFGASAARACIIRDNAADHGGGVNCGSAGCVDNCLIFGNSSVNGAGIDLDDGTVQNCTLFDNSASWFGGGLTCSGSAAVQNTIIFGNSAPSYSNCYVSGTSPEISFSCTMPPVAGVSNISQNPLFVAAAVEDFRLQEGSPCIDQGTALISIAADLDGVPRPLNGDDLGMARWDIGAYEAIHPQADTDSDGQCDRHEVIAGTDPTDPVDFFAIQCCNLVSDSFVLSRNGEVDRIYTLHTSTDLASGIWTNAPTFSDLPGKGQAMSVTNGPPLSEYSFYKVTVGLDQ